MITESPALPILINRVYPLVAVPVNFDFATAAVVSFVLMLLGLAAALLLMLRFTGKKN